MLDVIICANFGVEKLRGLGNTRGQILEFPIEMAGHLYNRAGATAQPVIMLLLEDNHHTSSNNTITICHQQGPQFSVGRGISSQAAEFALFHGILIFPQNSTEIEKRTVISTIVGCIK